MAAHAYTGTMDVAFTLLRFHLVDGTEPDEQFWNGMANALLSDCFMADLPFSHWQAWDQACKIKSRLGLMEAVLASASWAIREWTRLQCPPCREEWHRMAEQLWREAIERESEP